MDYENPWQAFLRGDKNALSEIFLMHHDDLVGYGIKLSGDEELVKDCIQDLFLKLWKNRNNLGPVQQIKPYLYKSLRNHIIDSLELRKHNANLVSDNETIFTLTYTEEDFLVNEEVSEAIRLKVIQALNKLTARQREIIYLRYFEELDFKTVSLVTGMNTQSVRNAIHRGMYILRKLMLIQPFFLLLSKSDIFKPSFF